MQKTTAFFVALPLTFATAVQGASVKKGPYLIYPNDNTRMKVLWQTTGTPSTSRLEWGSTTSYGNSRTVSQTGDYQYTHAITGLTPGRRVYYRVTVDGSLHSGSFLAARAGPWNPVAGEANVVGDGSVLDHTSSGSALCFRVLTWLE